MKGLKKWSEQLSCWKKLISCVLLLLLIGFLILLFYPTAGKITDGSLFLTLSCNIKLVSHVEPSGLYICNDEQDYTFKYLKEWKEYHGCNESTQGYNGGGGISHVATCNVVVLT